MNIVGFVCSQHTCLSVPPGIYDITASRSSRKDVGDVNSRVVFGRSVLWICARTFVRNIYRLLTVEVRLVRIVHQHAIVLRVPDPVAVDVRVAFVALAVAVRVQLIGIGRLWTIVHAVLDAVSATITFFGNGHHVL